MEKIQHIIIKRKPITETRSKYYLFRFIRVPFYIGRRLFFGGLLNKVNCGGKYS